MGGKPQPLPSAANSADTGISRTFDDKFVWNLHLLRDFPPECAAKIHAPLTN